MLVTTKSNKETHLFSEVTPKYIVDVCYKPNGTMRKSIPKRLDSLDKYILRIAQFISGINNHMPITADYDLKDYCESNDVEFRYVGESASKIRKCIDSRINIVLRELNQTDGLDVWAKALGMSNYKD